MKLHTFIIVTGDSDYVVEEANLSQDQLERLRYSEDGNGMRPISCTHPKFEDNVVTVPCKEDGEIELVRDSRGLLWYFHDSLSRDEAIRIFE